MMPSAMSWFINEFKAAHSTQIDFIEKFSAALVALDFTPVSQLVIVLNLRRIKACSFSLTLGSIGDFLCSFVGGW